MTPSRIISFLEEIHGRTTMGPWMQAQDHGEPADEVKCGGRPLYSASVAGTVDDARAIAAAHNALPALLKIARAAEEFIKKGCHDTCGREVAGDAYPCSCGQLELREALESLSKVDVGGEK